MARFAQHIFAGDADWWARYGHEIDIPARKWTSSRRAAVKYKLDLHVRYGKFNSGQRAIELAMELSRGVVILLGYDCTVRNGAHWHGGHTRTPDPNEVLCRKWQKQFERTARAARSRGITVINCSRDTALTCFQRMHLAQILREYYGNAG